jgi:hypothetical protein
MKHYIVETEIINGWEDCWTDGAGAPTRFATLDEAVDAIRDHVTDCINAVEGGDMEDSPDPTQLRIVEETQRKIGWEVTGIYECTNPAAFTYEAKP